MTQQAQATSTSSVRGWIVTFAALGINLASGTLYAWSVMGKALADPKGAHPWTKTEAAMPFAVATAAFAIAMIFAGRAQDKLGPKRVALLGGLVLGSGFIVASFAPTPAIMAACFAIVGVGIGLAYSATTPAAIKWFPPARKGLITGLVVAGVGLAPVYASPLADYLLRFQHVSIPATLQLLGIGTIVSISILSLIVRNPPAGFVPAGAAGAPGAKPRNVSRPDRDFKGMLATPQFYLLWVMFVLAAAPGLMIISMVAQMAKDMKWEAGFVPVIVLALCNASGRVVSGVVSDRLGRTNTMLLFFLLQACNMLAFPYYQNAELLSSVASTTGWDTATVSHLLLVFGAGFTGLCYGTIFTLMPAATADFWGLKNMGMNYGFVFTAFGVAGCTGALVAGKIRDIFGSYDRAFLIMAAMLAAAAVLALLTRAPKLLAGASAANPQPVKASL